MALYDLHLVRADSTSVRAWWRLEGDSWNDFAGVRVNWYVKWRGSSEWSHQPPAVTVTDYGDIFESAFTVPENATAVRAQVAVLHNSSGREWNETPWQVEYPYNPRDRSGDYVSNPTSVYISADGEDVFISWTCTLPDIDKFEVAWYERTNQGWVLKSTQFHDKSYTPWHMLYSPSATCTQVMALVKPVATREQWWTSSKGTSALPNPKLAAAERAKMANPQAPSPSVSMLVENSSERAVVTWSDVGELATHYRVYRYVNGTMEPEPAYTVARSAWSSNYRFVDGNLARGSFYQYRVRAVNAYKSSLASPVGWAESATTLPIVFPKPARCAKPSLSVQNADSEAATAAVYVKWEKPGQYNTVSGYELQWCDDGLFSSDGTQSATIDASYLSYRAEGLATNRTWRFRVRAVNSTGNGEWSEVASASTKATPRTPSVSAEMQGGRPKLTITCDDANASRVEVLRWKQGDTAYRSLVTLARKQSITWFDDGTEPGYGYSYLARALLSDGVTASGYSEQTYDDIGWLEREPAAPTGLRAEAASASGDSGSVRLRWSNAGYTGDGYEVRYTSDDTVDLTGASTGYSTQSFDGTLTQCEVSGLDAAKTWRFALRRTNSAGGSEWAKSPSGSRVVSAVVAATPEAPTTVATPLAVEAGEEVSLEWVHNCADGSAQQDAQVQVKVNSGQWTTVASNLGGQSYHDYVTSLLESGSSVSWRVRTKGLTAWSEWSEARTFRVWSPAQVGVSLAQGDFSELDGGDLESLPLRVSVAATVDATGENQVIEWWCEVSSVGGFETQAADGTDLSVADGEVLWSSTAKAGDSDWSAGNVRVRQFDIGAADMRFVGALRVSAGCLTAQGLSSRDDSNVVTCVLGGDVPQPGADLAVNGSDYSCAVAPYCHEAAPGEDGMPVLAEGVLLSVYRLDSDGSPLLVGSGMPNDGTAQCVDPYPLFGGCSYRIVATDPETGSQSVRDVAVAVPAPGVLVQWDGGSVLLPYNLELDERYAPDVAFREYSGRPDPVCYSGTQLGRTASWSAQVSKREGSPEVAALRELAGAMEPCHVREPSGTGYPAFVAVSSIKRSNVSGAVTVSLEVTRVDR